MAIQSNFPAIRPSLLLDFANSKRLDPRITFSRASTARFYDGSTVAKAEENLLLQSQDYSATWTVTNLTPVTGKTAPDGTSTATEFTAGAANATLTQSVTAIAADYTFSVWLRRVTGTGNIDISAHSGGTWVTQSISGTWARYTVTQALTAGARTPGIRVVTSGDVIEVWGAQLEQRSAVTAYTATTTAPITNYVPQLLTAQNNVPRFDHTPTTGESLGLLIEESRTNALTYSEDFADAAWSKNALSVTSNVGVAPDGTLTADLCVPDATAAAHFFRSTISQGSGVDSARSLYVKAAGYKYLGIGRNANDATDPIIFDVLAGTIVQQSAGDTFTGSITAVGNGWYRINTQYSGTLATARAPRYYVLPNDITFPYENDDTSTGDGYSGILVWGAQLEAGAFPTSYIPTVAASATRSADAASMTGTNFSSWYDAAEGTMYYEGAMELVANSAAVFTTFSDNTNDNYIGFRTGSTTEIRPSFAVGVSGTNYVNLFPTPASVANEFYRVAGAYKVNDFAVSKNGASALTDTTGILPVVDRLYFASAAGVVRTQRIKKFAYYPLRITDAQLSAITG